MSESAASRCGGSPADCCTCHPARSAYSERVVGGVERVHGADPVDYAVKVKAVWQGRVMQAAAKYGDTAPMTAVCCNACRTCATTNVLALASGAALAAVYGVARLGKKLVRAA